MNELQVQNYMLKNAKIKLHFKGVYSSDLLPWRLAKKGIYVVNTDPSTEPGSHWVVLSTFDLHKNIVDYFDSYGKTPIQEVLELLLRNGFFCRYNTKILQSSTSNVCGNYCIFFAYFMSYGYSMKEFVALFSDNVQRNDFLVQL